MFRKRLTYSCKDLKIQECRFKVKFFTETLVKICFGVWPPERKNSVPLLFLQRDYHSSSCWILFKL